MPDFSIPRKMCLLLDNTLLSKLSLPNPDVSEPAVRVLDGPHEALLAAREQEAKNRFVRSREEAV